MRGSGGHSQNYSRSQRRWRSGEVVKYTWGGRWWTCQETTSNHEHTARHSMVNSMETIPVTLNIIYPTVWTGWCLLGWYWQGGTTVALLSQVVYNVTFLDVWRYTFSFQVKHIKHILKAAKQTEHYAWLLHCKKNWQELNLANWPCKKCFANFNLVVFSTSQHNKMWAY